MALSSRRRSVRSETEYLPLCNPAPSLRLFVTPRLCRWHATLARWCRFTPSRPSNEVYALTLRRPLAGLVLAGGLLLAAAGPSQAARIRFLFVPDPAPGGELRAPIAGERFTVLGWQEY